jgi:hypothetical protein
MKPYQTLGLVGVELRGEIAGLIEDSHSDIDLSRKVVVPPGKRSAADLAKGTRNSRI